jgi:hypothetical protein
MSQGSRRRTLLAVLSLTAGAVVLVIVLVSTTGGSGGFAGALDRSNPYGTGSSVTLTTKLPVRHPVYLTPIFTVNRLRVSVLLESLSPLEHSSAVRFIGQYQMSGCSDRPAPLFDRFIGNNGPLTRAKPFWLHPGFLPAKECARYRYWFDKVEFLKPGHVDIAGFKAVYKVNGVAYVDDVRSLIYHLTIFSPVGRRSDQVSR